MILDRLFRETSPGRDTPTWSFFTKLIVGKDSPRGPMLTRYRIAQTPYGSIYVHNHHRLDDDRDCHNHPWSFITLILRGGYSEEFLPFPTEGRPRWFRIWYPFTVHRVLLSQAHRTIAVELNTWTLLVVGRKRQVWGFFTESGFVSWTEYNYASADPMDS